MLEIEEIRNLLRNFNMLQVYLTNLDKAIEYERGRATNGIIGAMSLTQSISGMPFPPAGTVSNKTADIAQSYKERAEKELQEMEQESKLIRNVLTQLDYAINSLTEPYKTLVTKHFFEEVKAKDLINFWGGASEQRNERTIRRILRKSLCKISKLVNIPKIDYHYIISQERLHF